MADIEKTALSYLPARLRDAAARTRGDEPVSEIRLRAGGLLTLTTRKSNLSSGVFCTAAEVVDTAARLCEGSLYAHADEIRDGVIATESGIRAGVAGHAVSDGGRVLAVRDVTSVNMRIPQRVSGAADPILPLARAGLSLLLCGGVGTGKTTALRELIVRLASRDSRRRVSVIDTRYELGAGIREAVTADFFRGYPRPAGMEAAVRAMSPEFLICDEIAGSADCEAIRAVRAAGVAVAASAHAVSEAGLTKNREIASLLADGLFDALAFIGADGKIEVKRLA